jgi:hypothetical protein
MSKVYSKRWVSTVARSMTYSNDHVRSFGQSRCVIRTMALCVLTSHNSGLANVLFFRSGRKSNQGQKLCIALLGSCLAFTSMVEKASSTLACCCEEGGGGGGSNIPLLAS